MSTERERNRVDLLQAHTLRVLPGGASISMRLVSALGNWTIQVAGVVRRR
jgi:hypothetical protein